MSIVENEESTNIINKNKKIALRLSDIIYIMSPNNEILNNQSYIIDYIDNKKMYIINIKDLTKHKVKFNENGSPEDMSIKNIIIVDRNKEQGYARQHKLLPSKWINVYFNGNLPSVLTGQITDLEEDMIEIKTYPNNETIYINFNYKGIPEDIPIERIDIREKPDNVNLLDENEKGVDKSEEKEEKQEDEEKKGEENENDLEEEDKDVEMNIDMDIQERKNIQNKESNKENNYEENDEENDEEYDEEYEVRKKELMNLEEAKDKLKKNILSADEIVFKGKKGPVTISKVLPESKQQYNINVQTNDMLDELLSKIPENRRSFTIMNNIHTLIERFKQLREEYSSFDNYGNVIGSIIKDEKWRPLIQSLKTFKNKLYWILPVAKNIKKLYNINYDSSLDSNLDIEPLKIIDNLEEIKQLFERYNSVQDSSDLNKYDLLLSGLNSYLTPFTEIDPEEINEVITNINIESELNVIIDNLNNFESSVANPSNVASKRFLFTNYEKGISRLQTTQKSTSSMKTQPFEITQSDILALKSLVIFPDSVMRYSQISLPGTSIYEKSNFNNTFIYYSQFMNKYTNVDKISIDNLNKEYTLKNNNQIKNYSINRSNEMNQLSNNELYDKYLSAVVPSTEKLFNLIKKYIHGTLSVYKTITYLEPFLVYTRDVNYEQYKEIKSFINDKISDYNKTFKNHHKAFNLFKSYKRGFEPNYKVLQELLQKNDTSVNIFNNYNPYELKLTNSELLWKMKLIDYANMYDTELALNQIDLMLPETINSIINKLEEQKKITKKNISEEEKENKCKQIVIAKEYKNESELNEDNEKLVFFDKKYDNTPYDIMDEYVKEQNVMGTDKFYEYLIDKLVDKYKYNKTDAPRIATNLINGKKQIKEGDYATIFQPIEGKLKYYQRKDDKWSLDKSLDKMDINQEDMFCNFQKDCIEIEDKYNKICQSYDLNKQQLNENALKEMISQFDLTADTSRENLKKILEKNTKYRQDIYEKINKIHITRDEKYNNQKYKIGLQLTDQEQIVSPHSSKLNKILGESNFVKKQHDIVDFARKYTRLPVVLDDGGEDINWRYCINTSTKLLPAFLYTLAITYINNPDEYDNVLTQIINNIGKESDDGNAWVDKYSGMVITQDVFEYSEGYDKGFKIVSREIMEKDAGDALLSAKNKTIKYSSKENKMIYNIVTALGENMGININDQVEFIIDIVTQILHGGEILPSEEEYKKIVMEESKKKKVTRANYETLYNTSIMYLTLDAYLIAIQTSIPSIKTRITFPGCVRSFGGYPFEGAGDKSGLKYVACIAHKIRKESIVPWNTLMKKKIDVIESKMISIIDDFYLKLPVIKDRIEKKLEYLMIEPNIDIPTEYQVTNWKTFLPPLVPLKLKTIENISDDFKDSLKTQLKNGNSDQNNKLLLILSKIMFFSLDIQEQIQNVVEKKKLLLTNISGDPFIENACCNDNINKSVIEYFIKDANSISLDIKTINYLSDIIDEVKIISRSSVLYSRENTKNIYGTLTDEYNEETIYRAFINYCHFNSLVPISSDLMSVCTEKPENFSKNDSLTEQIRKLKMDGIKYDTESFLKLMQIVDKNHIIKIDTTPYANTKIQYMRKLVRQMKDDKDIIMNKTFIDKLYDLLDTYDPTANENHDVMDNMKNYLGENNEKMINELIDFIKFNNDNHKNTCKKMKDILNDIMKWGEGDKAGSKISENTTYNAINFIQEIIFSLVKVFPYIIKNKVNYESIIIPKYYKISVYDTLKIQNKVKSYYSKLRMFYDNSILSNILVTIHKRYNLLLELINTTPYLSDIKYNNEIKESIFDEELIKLLFQYYLLFVLIEYKNLSDDKNMIIDENNENEDELEESRIISNWTPIVNAANMKDLRIQVSKLLCSYIHILEDQKSIVSLDYNKIMDMIFKSKNYEKNEIVKRIGDLTKEEKTIDTILKINKLGVWNKGLQKGLTTYVIDGDDSERNLMENIALIETRARQNINAVDNNIDQITEEYLENQDIIDEIEKEENDISNFEGDGDYIDEDGYEDDYGYEEDYRNYDDYE
jgi:hypothetical protein